MTGTVTKFEHGWGWVKAEDGRSVFVHRTEIVAGRRGLLGLLVGDRVEFDVEDTPKGWRAVRVVRREGAA